MDQVLNITMIILSSSLVLFAPGFFISLLLFNFGKIDFLERIALSFALSISVIPLLTFYLNLIGLKISSGLVVAEVLAICLVSSTIYFFKYYKK